jgi:hypothetical protein
MNLPNVYGAGAQFAYSGLEGETDYDSDIVGTLTGDSIGICFETRIRRYLRFILNEGMRVIEYRCVLNDMLQARLINAGGEGEIEIYFHDKNRIIGSCQLAQVQLIGDPGAESIWCDGGWLSEGDGTSAVLLTKDSSDKTIFCLAFAKSKAEGYALAKSGLNLSLEDCAKRKLAFYEALPSCPVAQAGFERTWYKAFSILRNNVMGPQGENKGLWTTPDRVPHRNMWLWDSAFHALGLSYISGDLAWQSIEAVLNRQRDDGFIPHMMTPYSYSEITQPPILAFSTWQVYQMHPEYERLEKVYPKLASYLEWDLANRDRLGHGLLSWRIEGDPLCRSGESGADNSPRFDQGMDMDAVDFSAFAANDMLYMQKIANTLCHAAQAAAWHERYLLMIHAMKEHLWSEKDGFFYDTYQDGSHSKVATTASLYPLLLPDMFSGTELESLCKHIENPGEFMTRMPLPSVSVGNREHGTDMWRGGVWINTNFLVASGLLEQRKEDLARRIAIPTLWTIVNWYERTGSLYEFYHCDDTIPPVRLDRKGLYTPPVDIRRKIFTIADYGWTASLFIAMLMNKSLTGDLHA